MAPRFTGLAEPIAKSFNDNEGEYEMITPLLSGKGILRRDKKWQKSKLTEG